MSTTRALDSGAPRTRRAARGLRSGGALTALLLAVASTGCMDERKCHEEMTAAQNVVNGIDSHSIESLRGAVSSLDTAIAACDKAKLGAEKGKLEEAKHQIGAQLALLERKAERKKSGPLTAEELAALEKDGDPSCPKGQAYRHPGAPKEIRCTGPQLIDMSMDAVKSYFEARDYKLTVTAAPPRIRAERGAELFVFTFDKAGDESGPKCLEVYPAPDIPWREAVGRATGTRLDKLKNGGTIAAKRGDLPLSVVNTAKEVLAKIGDCAG